ncbi:hypothetical protein Tco_0703397 [Tanacetum coccineum]|uniref:Uncharacterized protein n=1 Tax=Tanacetum coccineum TaxID=301880 RepID=A0ABQ4XZ76_9ASTR
MSSDTKFTKDEECESVDSTKYRGMIGEMNLEDELRPSPLNEALSSRLVANFENGRVRRKDAGYFIPELRLSFHVYSAPCPMESNELWTMGLLRLASSNLIHDLKTASSTKRRFSSNLDLILRHSENNMAPQTFLEV